MADATTTTATSSTKSSTTSRTPTYTPFTITSFPRIPLTTTFTATNSVCSDIHVGNSNILFIDDQTKSCLPSGFNSAPTAFFSPGIACPSGYWTACSNSDGASSITTYTCCPTRGTSIQMSCVDPATLDGGWVNQYCTWTAGNSRIPIEVVQVSGGSTSRMFKTLSGGDGINALGVRMVHQTTDLPSSVPASTSSPSPTSLPTQETPPLPGSGLSLGATVAIGVTVPVVVLAMLMGLLMFWRKRRRKARGEILAPAPGAPRNETEGSQYDKVYYSGVPPAPQELPSYWNRGLHPAEMPETRAAAELSGDARPAARLQY